jgi:hypothetical protein
MAHYAEVIDGTVARVVVVHNDVTTIDGVEDEQRGIDFLNGLFPDSATWVQTSYNRTIRHNYASSGYTWDGTGFAAPQPYGSWALDENYLWQPPVAQVPGYGWDEATLAWVQPDTLFPSWVWASDQWTPPTPYPGVFTEDGPQAPFYKWDEDTTSWVEVE